MDEKKHYLRCFAGVIDKDVIYVYNNTHHLIMRYDLKDFSYEIIGQLQSCMLYKNSAISMLKYEKYLYLIMFRRLCIFRYDLANKRAEEYTLNDLFLSPNELTWKSFMHKSQIWLFSVCAGREIIVFDCITRKFRSWHSIMKLFKKKKVRIEAEDGLSRLFQVNDKIWGAICGLSYIFSISMSERDITIFSINCIGINSFDYDGNDFWITVCDSNQIIKWNPDYGITDSYYVDNINFFDYPYCYVCGSKNSILVVPNSDKDFYLIDRETKQILFLPLVGRYQRLSLNSGNALFGDYLRVHNKLVLLPYDIDKIIVVDLDDNTVECKEGILLKDDYENVYIINKLTTGKVKEDLLYRLSDYIKYVGKSVYHSNSEGCKKKNGKKILEEVCRQIYE